MVCVLCVCVPQKRAIQPQEPFFFNIGRDEMKKVKEIEYKKVGGQRAV